MTVVHGDKLDNKHVVMKVTCDFCGEKMNSEFDCRGFVVVRFNYDHADSYDGCDKCLTLLRERIKKRIKRNSKG